MSKKLVNNQSLNLFFLVLAYSPLTPFAPRPHNTLLVMYTKLLAQPIASRGLLFAFTNFTILLLLPFMISFFLVKKHIHLDLIFAICILYSQFLPLLDIEYSFPSHPPLKPCSPRPFNTVAQALQWCGPGGFYVQGKCFLLE